MLYIAASAGRAERLSRALQGLAPELEPVHFLPWDCLPYDRAHPSRQVMGRRLKVLHQLAQKRRKPGIVVSSPDALIQRVPDRKRVAALPVRLKLGETFSLRDLKSVLLRAGYVIDQQVDEPGEAALRGKVVDLFPAASASPFRIDHDAAVITEIRQFDPVSQLTGLSVEEIRIDPAVEFDMRPADVAAGRQAAPWMQQHASETFFDYVADATLILEAKAENRRRVAMQQVAESFEASKALSRHDGPRTISPPQKIYLSDAEWASKLSGSLVWEIGESSKDIPSGAVPVFALEQDPDGSFAAFVRRQLQLGRRVVLTAATDKVLDSAKRRTDRLIGKHTPRIAAQNWQTIAASPQRSMTYLKVDLDGGFVDEAAGIVVIAATDLMGSEAREIPTPVSSPTWPEAPWRIGDTVVHLDHGMARLGGLEPIEADSEGEFEAIALEFANEAKLLVPFDELDRVWPYGSKAAVPLDRLDSSAWQRRRAEIETEIAATASRFIALARQREQQRGTQLIPERQAYERFLARFPYEETPDQLRAITDTLNDLSSGRRMDRLVCGDVGYGKTEVALRAAAAAALSGKQVVVVAPTTVLARQHLQTFQSRFAGFDVKVEELSRAATPAEARRVKNGLKNGSVHIAIATHAILGKNIAFKNLGLVVIDEEQRFGAAQKTQLRDLAKDTHLLTLTATPIPRTLQAALVGLRELSILATPPVHRQPIETVAVPLNENVCREALMRERRRGGQSFVVCPRIKDIAPMEARLRAWVPDLRLVIVHGRMPADRVDDEMLQFAQGAGDVLLATNIIENGLDLPNANTMLIWHAHQFGLAQLHQLRGRVGRSKRRGVVYLLTDPGTRHASSALQRLRTLEQQRRLGAGFEISSQDLELRGAGTLLGDEQTGHIELIGAALYRHLFERAVKIARGIPASGSWAPELNLSMKGHIPRTYMPEDELRIDLYARLARVCGLREIQALRQEVEDRFGAPPSTVQQLFARVLLKQFCRELRIARIDAGPQAIAMTFEPGKPTKLAKQVALRSNASLEWTRRRLLYRRGTTSLGERQQLAIKLLSKLRRLFRALPDEI